MHRSALGAGALSDEWAAKRLPEHRKRADFVFLAARPATRSSGSPTATPARTGNGGRRASRARSARGQREEWLDVPHYEVVELHVRPTWQRQGIGSALLAQLLTRQPHDRALLSTQLGSRKARGFYAKNGWQELASVDFGTGYPPYVVLGKTP